MVQLEFSAPDKSWVLCLMLWIWCPLPQWNTLRCKVSCSTSWMMRTKALLSLLTSLHQKWNHFLKTSVVLRPCLSQWSSSRNLLSKKINQCVKLTESQTFTPIFMKMLWQTMFLDFVRNVSLTQMVFLST